MTANTYGHYDALDITHRLIGDIQHFAKKHGCIPTCVMMPPCLLPEVREITIRNDGTGQEYTVQLIEDRRQLDSSYLIVADNVLDSQGERV